MGALVADDRFTATGGWAASSLLRLRLSSHVPENEGIGALWDDAREQNSQKLKTNAQADLDMTGIVTEEQSKCGWASAYN